MTGLGPLPEGTTRDAAVAHVRAVLDATLPGDGMLVVACSGGPDSVTLAHLVRSARPAAALVLACVRHGLRDDAADMAVVTAHARQLDAELDELPVTVTDSGGPEAAARAARIDVLVDTAHRRGAAGVLLGHTADDQAETVLLRIARGTGVDGLSGMAVRRDHEGMPIVRPLLGVRRADVHAVAATLEPPPVRDPTNDDRRLRRNRLRAEVLPGLAALAGGPGDVVGLISRLADLARDDVAVLSGLVAPIPIREWGSVRAVATADLPEEVALVRRLIRRLLAAVPGGPRSPSAAAVEAVRSARAGQVIHPGAQMAVSRGGGWLAAAPLDAPALGARPLGTGGVDLPELGVHLRRGAPGSGGDHPIRPPWGRGPAVLEVGADRLAGAWVRPPADGDRLALGDHSRSLADVLSDAGVPRVARPLTPVLVDADDQPLWVPGVAVRSGIAGEVRVTVTSRSGADLG